MKKIFLSALLFLAGTLAGIWLQKSFFAPKSAPIFVESVAKTEQQSAVGDGSVQLVSDQTIQPSRETAITQSVRKISPAVVGINVLQKSYRSPGMMMDDPFFRYFFGERQELVKSLGSGFIISPDGYIVTNEHVVHQAVKIMVTLPDGEHFDAKLMASDYVSDIALLKIESDKSFPFAVLGNSNDLIIGEWAIAIGNPFGLFDMGQPSVSQGIISATDRDFGKQSDNRIYKDMIQTDAAINAGNSGGPLVNSLGEVIGMNTFIFSGSESRGTSIGLGFAIPINRIKKIVAALRKYGSVDRSFWTGISVINLRPYLARYLGIPIDKGVIVASVQKNSPASRANIEVGDIILKINDYTVESSDQIDTIFEDLDAKAGDIITLTIYHNKKVITIPFKLEKYPRRN
ncbi:MAG: trypsin-like serine protease [Calditrichaeota bacterium]|nr:trypsin-like serine protease [Calditrichota bacterium]